MNRYFLDVPGFGEFYLAARGGLRPLRATRASDLVVDGFPRSANTYAFYALKHVLPASCVVSGHTHSARNIIRSCALGIPTIVPLREPRSAIASLVQLAPELRVRTAAAGYESFHRHLLPHADEIVVAPFETVIADLGAVVAAVNERHGTQFPTYERTELNEAAVRALVEESSLRRAGGKVSESSVARPSSSRRSAREVLSGLDDAAEEALERAGAVYRQLLAR